MADHQFMIGDGADLAAVANDDALANWVGEASDGGHAVQRWFADDMSALHVLNQAIVSGGDTAWIEGQDIETGLPTYTAVMGAASLTVGVFVTDAGRAILQTDTPQLATYGFAYLTLITDRDTPAQTITQVATNTLEYAGPGIPNLEVGTGLRTLLSSIISNVKSYVQKLIELFAEVTAAATPAAAARAATAGAGTAAEEASGQAAVAITKDEVIQIQIGFAEAAGLVLSLGALVAGVVLRLLEKRLLSFVRVFNLTDTEVELSLCWMTPDTDLASGPMLPNAPVYLPGTTPAWTPPWIIGDAPAHYLSLVLGNTDTLKGLGYVLKAMPRGDFPGFQVAVNVPNAETNSFGIGFGTASSCHDYWTTHKDDSQELSGEVESDGWRLSIATNQTSGRSSSPVDGTKGYFYEHAIVLAKP